MDSAKKNVVNPGNLKILILSTPKTGNTWIKHLLASIYELPMVKVGLRFDADEVDALGARWITHQHYGMQPHILDYGEHNDVVFVTTIRHPGDALLSKFHFVRNYIDQLTFSDIDLSPLMARDGDTVGEHTAYYVRHGFHISLDISLNWMRTGRSHVIRYEDLWRDPVPALRQLTSTIYEVPLDRIERSIELCDFDLMRTMSETDAKFFRKGTVGNWKHELPQQIIDIFRHTEPFPSQFAELGYTLDSDDPLTTLPRKPWVSKNPFHNITHFDNRVPVPLPAVRLYMSLDPAMCKRWPAVEETTAGSFYSWLNSPVDKDIDQQDSVPIVTNLAYYMYRTHPQIQAEYPDVFGADRFSFVVWFVTAASAKYGIDRAFVLPAHKALLAWCALPVEEATLGARSGPLLTNLALYIYNNRPDLQTAFPHVLGGDRLRFAHWFVNRAMAEYAANEALVELIEPSVSVMSKSFSATDGLALLLSSLRRRLSSLVRKMQTIWLR